MDQGNEIQRSKEEEPRELICVQEEMPYLLDCAYTNDRHERKKCSDQKILETIYSNLRYPITGECSIEGNIYIRFVIEKNGSRSKLEVIRGIHPLFDAEALRVVRLLPPFAPGKMFGKPIAIQYALPIKIRLE